jgi:hypothetical protein
MIIIALSFILTTSTGGRYEERANQSPAQPTQAAEVQLGL